jgi:hypothetical protein
MVMDQEHRAQVETQRADFLEWMDDFSRRSATSDQPTNGEIQAFAKAFRWFSETAPEREKTNA